MKKFSSLMAEGNKEEYQKFYNGKLAKWKIKSPEELSDEDKKKFYNEIDKEWESDDEEDGIEEYIKQDGARRRVRNGDGRRRKSVKTEEDELDEQTLNEAMYSEKQINKACKKMKMSPAEVGEFYSYLEGK